MPFSSRVCDKKAGRELQSFSKKTVNFTEFWKSGPRRRPNASFVKLRRRLCPGATEASACNCRERYSGTPNF